MTPHPIRLVLELAARTYAASLTSFRPWITTYERNNVIAEANITFHVARAFCSVFTGGNAFLEREFRREDAGRNVSLKLDAYLTSLELALLFEAKVLVDSSTALGILDDVDRASADAAGQQLVLHVGQRPPETRGLIVAECWKPDLQSWWHTGEVGKRLGKRLSVSTDRRGIAAAGGWTFDAVQVGTFEHGSPAEGAGKTCWWLYAVGPSYPSGASAA